jgi:hypothetical protein
MDPPRIQSLYTRQVRTTSARHSGKCTARAAAPLCGRSLLKGKRSKHFFLLFIYTSFACATTAAPTSQLSARACALKIHATIWRCYSLFFNTFAYRNSLSLFIAGPNMANCQACRFGSTAQEMLPEAILLLFYHPIKFNFEHFFTFCFKKKLLPKQPKLNACRMFFINLNWLGITKLENCM